MKIESTSIDGLKVVHLDRINDIRGSFLKVFNEDFFKLNNMETDFRESYFSVSAKNVIRGMHFQIPPFDHVKLVYINQGAISDVVLDIRKGSPTYGRYFNFRMTQEIPVLLYIPKGCAHGFLSLEDNTIVSYLQSTVYNQTCDKGIKYDSFGVDWGIINPVLSSRDLTFPEFSQINYEFSL